MSLLEVFCDVDDFMLSFAPQLEAIQLQQASSESAQASSPQ